MAREMPHPLDILLVGTIDNHRNRSLCVHPTSIQRNKVLIEGLEILAIQLQSHVRYSIMRIDYVIMLIDLVLFANYLSTTGACFEMS